MNKSISSNKHTAYPIILVHGIILKDIAFFKAFGRIEKLLKKQGYSVYTAKIDGFGTIENNAEQLKTYITKILKTENCKKVNLIAHSKGGLDSKYMITRLDGDKFVASLTTLCTPHKGSPIASNLLRMPKFIVKFIAFWINLVYKIFGDKHPNALEVCRQLQLNDNIDAIPANVYCQSYSVTMEKCRDDFIMSIPLAFSRHWDNNVPSDGLVSVESSKFGEYKGDCIDGSVSHSEIVGFSANKKKRAGIYDFYTQLCNELMSKGF